MSLDVNLCIIVAPEDANGVEELFPWSRRPGNIADTLALHFQPKGGVLPLKRTRIGRNCATDEWHRLDRESWYNVENGTDEQERCDGETRQLKLFLPEDFGRLLPFILPPEAMSDGQWFEGIPADLPADGRYYIHISW